MHISAFAIHIHIRAHTVTVAVCTVYNHPKWMP